MFRRLAPRRTLLGGLLFANLLLFSALYFFFSGSHEPPAHILAHPYFQYDLDVREPRDSRQKCILPRYHPFDPSIWGIFAAQKKIVCKDRRSDLTYIDEKGWLRFNESEVIDSGYQVGSSLNCRWSPVIRPDGDDDKVIYGSEVPLTQVGTNLPSGVEIVRVQCSNLFGLSVYEKLHVRIRDVPQSGKETTRPKNPVNVLIFGVDSMSRLSFIRLLPSTYKYLTEDLGMTVFRGMNKVGDNSYPNLIPLLTGQKAYGGGLPEIINKYFDNFPLIWKKYSDAGYATMWAEDFPQFGLFNYLEKGFRHVPTDHYLRPYWLAVEESSLLKHSSHMCYGSQPKYMAQLDYARRFVATYKEAGKPYFGFSFLIEISHEYVSRINAADDHFLSFFRFLRDDGHLENTALFVMSDHGHRFDAIRTTQVGHAEERLPFFAVRLPRSISALQPSLSEKLRVNSGRLVTPFDAHATLLDLLHFAASSRLLGQSFQSPAVSLGQSLFQEVPDDRTCQDASIPPTFCVCEVQVTIPVIDVRAQLAADAIVHHVNKLMEEGGPETASRCAVLNLGHVKSAHIVHTLDDEEEGLKSRVRVVLMVEPSHGILEGTVLVHEGVAEVTGEVSRLDPYGDQSACIDHAILRKYCYCSRSSDSFAPNATGS